MTGQRHTASSTANVIQQEAYDQVVVDHLDFQRQCDLFRIHEQSFDMRRVLQRVHYTLWCSDLPSHCFTAPVKHFDSGKLTCLG
jgi:hypothetical protein